MSMATMINSGRWDLAMAEIKSYSWMSHNLIMDRFTNSDVEALLTAKVDYVEWREAIGSLCNRNETREILTSSLWQYETRLQNDYKTILQNRSVRRLVSEDADSIHPDLAIPLIVWNRSGGKSAISGAFINTDSDFVDLPSKMLKRSDLTREQRLSVAVWLFFEQFNPKPKSGSNLSKIYSVVEAILKEAAPMQRETMILAVCLAANYSRKWQAPSADPSARNVAERTKLFAIRNRSIRFLMNALGAREWIMQNMADEPRVLHAMLWSGVFNQADKRWLEVCINNGRPDKMVGDAFECLPYLPALQRLRLMNIPDSSEVEWGDLRATFDRWVTIGHGLSTRDGWCVYDDEKETLPEHVELMQLAYANGVSCAAKTVESFNGYKAALHAFPICEHEQILAHLTPKARRAIVRKQMSGMEF